MPALSVWWLAAVSWGWDELGPNGVSTGRAITAADHFVSAPPQWAGAVAATSPLDLGAVARETAERLRAQPADSRLGRPTALSEVGIGPADVLETLDLIARVSEEDRGEVRQRLADPEWLAETFEVWRWSPDRDAAAARRIALPADEVRLTKYVVYTVAGSPVRTDVLDTALYAMASAPTVTRMAVYAGAFEAGGSHEGQASAAVWLTREGANQALMQGSIEVVLPDGSRQLYNVHQNNGIAWDPAIKDSNQQPRYWTFREVDGVLGVEQIPLRAGATVAGDIHNLGLGVLVALEWPGKGGPELRLVVLADTGGAFQPNLFQLDYLAGTFPSVAAYKQWASSTPTRVPAHILVRRR